MDTAKVESFQPGRKGDLLSLSVWGWTGGSWPPGESCPAQCWTNGGLGEEPAKNNIGLDAHGKQHGNQLGTST